MLKSFRALPTFSILLAGAVGWMLPAAAEEPPQPPEPPSGWVAKRIYDPFRNSSRCVVESAHQKINDGYQETDVFVRLDAKTLELVTESNLDLRRPDFGLQVGENKPLRPDRLTLDQTAVFESDIKKIITQFGSGKVLVFRLYFWPTWPSKGLRTVRYSTRGFGQAFERLPAC